MGLGDELMATGMARGSLERGKRVAFGDGRKIVWGPWCEEVFRHNPNVAQPGTEHLGDVEWIHHYKGHRLYNRLVVHDRWVWNQNFRAQPGEMFFTDTEKMQAERAGSNFVLIEPNVPWHKSVAPNKDWGLSKYQEVAKKLIDDGVDVVQFAYGRDHLHGVRIIHTHGFRDALAILSRANLAIVPEGGLHHGAAAVGVRAIVLFGGFIPPQVTGYASHVNLTGGEVACGSLNRCDHCRRAMESISIKHVYETVLYMLMHRSTVSEKMAFAC